MPYLISLYIEIESGISFIISEFITELPNSVLGNLSPRLIMAAIVIIEAAKLTSCSPGHMQTYGCRDERYSDPSSVDRSHLRAGVAVIMKN